MRKFFSGSMTKLALTILTFFAILPGGARAQRASGQPDFSGVWVTTGGGAPYGLEEQASAMQPSAKQKFDDAQHGPNAALNFAANNDPYIRYCDPLGVPRILLANHPFKMVQAPGELIILYERSRGFREIYMDGREHPKDLDPSWWGDSIGKWDGDTLVIDSVGFNDRTWVDYMGLPHSDALHVVERYRRVAANTLQLDLTIDDPKAYTKPWSVTIKYSLKSWNLGEDICTLSDEENFEQGIAKSRNAAPVKK
jgi:hypothetical protein